MSEQLAEEQRFLPADRSLTRELEVTSTVDRQVYTPEEVAKMLGLHPNSVYSMLKNGAFPGLKAGGRWLISKRRFSAWLDGRET